METSVNHVLIPFDMLYDTEMGLIKLIRQSFLDPDEFEDGLFLAADGVIKQLLKERESKNPLSDFVKDPKDAEFYYKEFMTKKYDEILKLSPKTGIYDLVNSIMNTNNQIVITVLCKNLLENDIVENDLMSGKVGCIYIENYEDIDLRLYDTIYTKDIRDLGLYGSMFDGKNVYVASYYHNYTEGAEEPILDIELSLVLLDKADTSIIDMYPSDDYILSEG